MECSRAAAGCRFTAMWNHYFGPPALHSGHESSRRAQHEQLPYGAEVARRVARGRARHCLALTFLFLLLLPVLVTPLACARQPAESKALVRITNVKVTGTGEQTLKVTFDYDLEPGVKLPLPYKEVLVFPLEPQVKLAGTLEPFLLSVGSVAVSLEVPAEAGFNWKDLRDKETCCLVSLKGVREESETNTPRYERISNEVRVRPPELSS